MKQKSILWAKIPYSNLEEEKLRPVLVLSNDRYNKDNLDIVVCAITSNLDKKLYSVFISQNDLSEGHLPIESKIKTDKLFQIEKKRIAGKLGTLKPQKFSLVILELMNLFKWHKI